MLPLRFELKNKSFILFLFLEGQIAILNAVKKNFQKDNQLIIKA